MVLRHARPHLEIHSRSKGHSAVAGAAYRLGLKLWDERLQVWHDYTRRALGEEVVMAMTVAPDGAPEWATDPGRLWNAVELAEKRKDSQVARDYRIPIPLGLDDHRAGRLAEKLARFIMGELGTPVSVGLHRDADTDALGNVKPADRQGFHVHLYFPSRPLVMLPAKEEGGEGSHEEGTAAFGARHPMLASKALGRGMVETFNRVWAELSTEAAADAGLDARYDHRSYERMGVDLTPQPTLGAGATALERKGFWTRKGDALRDIVVVSHAYELAHAEVIAVQQQAARLEEKGAEAGHPSVPDMEPAGEPAPTGSPPVHPDLILPTLGADVPLVTRFQSLVPRPSPEDGARWPRVQRLVRAIQRALSVIRELAGRLVDAEDRMRRTKLVELEARYELDQARRRRAAATIRAEAWAKAHPVRMRAGKLVGRKPAAWRNLSHDLRFHQKAVQAAKDIVASQTREVVERQAETGKLQNRLATVRGRLRSVASEIGHVGSDYLPPLVAALTPEQREELVPLLEIFDQGKERVAVRPDDQLAYRPPGLRPLSAKWLRNV